MANSRVTSIHRRAHLIHGQIASAMTILEKSGKDPQSVLSDDSPYLSLLSALYEEEYQLAKISATSDIVIHAEGPSTVDFPVLSLVSALFLDIGKQFRTLAKSVLPLSLDDIRGAMKKLDIRLTGLAPGSIYAGFAINNPPPLPLLATEEEDSAVAAVKDVITKLAIVPKYIRDDGIDPSISDAITDPAIRDIALMAAFNLAPTGRRGIHTLEIASPHVNEKPSQLTQMGRTVLMEFVVKRPVAGKKKKLGAFTGELRALDLDKNRVVLRNIEQGGSLMCILPLTLGKAKQLIGKTVRVTGEYETDANGRPRLMVVREANPTGNMEIPTT
jgi:hypothetical protein